MQTLYTLALACEPSYLYPWNHLTPLLTQDRPGSAVAAQWLEPPAHSGLWKEADGWFFFFCCLAADRLRRTKVGWGGKSRDVIVRTWTTKPLLLLLWQGREDGAARPAGRPGEGSNQLLHSPPSLTHLPTIVIQQECACPYLVRAPVVTTGSVSVRHLRPVLPHRGPPSAGPRHGTMSECQQRLNGSWSERAWPPTPCGRCIFNGWLHQRGIIRRWGGRKKRPGTAVSWAPLLIL